MRLWIRRCCENVWGGLGLAAKVMYDELTLQVTPLRCREAGYFYNRTADGYGRTRVLLLRGLHLNSFNPKMCSPGFGGAFWAVELKPSG